METLPAFLKRRSARAQRHLIELVTDVTPEEAMRDCHAQWPGQRWGIGQDGSISGIVYHVAAWKSIGLPLLAPAGAALTEAEFRALRKPAADDWPGLVSWLDVIGAEWSATLEALPESEFEETRIYQEWTWTLAQFVTEWYEHDLQHFAQIEYLRQRHRADGM